MAETDPSLHDIPPSAFLCSLCAYLTTADLLSLRATTKRIHNLLHDEQESEELWKLLLKRCYGFNTNAGGDQDYKKTLKVAPLAQPERSTPSCSIFGVDPWEDDVILETSTAFESWKGWTKVSSRFCRRSPHEPPESEWVLTEDRRRLNGPFFLRAAQFWKRVFDWCDNPNRSGDLGANIRTTLTTGQGPGKRDWSIECQTQPGLEACHALFAFGRGQQEGIFRGLSGLLGGYHAYGYYSSLALFYSPRVAQISPSVRCVAVAGDTMAPNSGLEKEFVVDIQSGSLYALASNQVEHAINRNNNNDDSRADDVLVWLEEYVRRLETGYYRVQPIAPNDARRIGSITLYPDFPYGSALPITEGIQTVSRAVTRGVEVVASGVYVPQARNQFGFIYSIRLRLLTPGEQDYVSASERGFETCQLQSRHWRITDDTEGGNTNQVDGEGVIGMYPLLEEGGYRLGEGRERQDRVFQYQSCTGPMPHGSFAGYLRFVPGNLQSPAGPAFDVELRPFELTNRPAFLY